MHKLVAESLVDGFISLQNCFFSAPAIIGADSDVVPEHDTVPIPSKLQLAEDLDSIPMPIQPMASAPIWEPIFGPTSKEEHPQADWPSTHGAVIRAIGVSTQTETNTVMVSTTSGTQSEAALCRDACVQSQTTYTAVRGVMHPRFQPLAEDSHGCFGRR